MSRALIPARDGAAYQVSAQLRDVERVAHRLERMMDDPAIQPYRDALVGDVVAVLDQVAAVLRHQAGDRGSEP